MIFRWAGVYARYWRYASVDEMLLLADSVTGAVLLAGGVSLAVVQLLPTRPPLPRSIPFIFLLLALWSPRLARALPCGCQRVRWPASVLMDRKKTSRPSRS